MADFLNHTTEHEERRPLMRTDQWIAVILAVFLLTWLYAPIIQRSMGAVP
jgi:hypothetical protein